MASVISLELKNYFSSQAYKEALDNAVAFSKRLTEERKDRLPFYDSQTGLNQQDCYIWRNRAERKKGRLLGQVYCYFPRRWRFSNEPHPKKEPKKVVLENKVPSAPVVTVVSNPETTNSVPKRTPRASDFSRRNDGRSSRYRIDDSESEDEPEAAPVIDDDDDSDDDVSVKRRSRRTRTTVLPTPPKPRKEQTTTDSAEAPFQCKECSRRYKTPPALKAHITKYHSANSSTNNLTVPRGAANVTVSRSTASVTVPRGATNVSIPRVPSGVVNANSTANPPQPPPTNNTSVSDSITSPQADEKPATKISRRSSNSSNVSNDEVVLQKRTRNKKTHVRYCDFCLGDEGVNKITGKAEKMVVCSKCGRCAHPSCLKFTPALAAIIMTYQWECIECKSCAICNKSDQEEQILFCDDCDRGYHMFCVTPPIKEPPEGSWSCDVCLHRLGKK